MITGSTSTGVLVQVPRQFGKYTYVRTIGSAASCVVFLVVDPTGHEYAAKCVKREYLLTDGNLEHFERETRLLQFLRHPNIVELHDIVYQPENIILIMEYCEHGDLLEEMEKSDGLEICRVRSYTYQLLKGLQCLHEKGFAHRDLKPENILICSNSVVKIADFGLARAVPPSGMMTTMCGSVHYIAPEVLQELPYDGRKADIWSLGILLFAMHLNHIPWSSHDGPSVVREIIEGEMICPAAMAHEIREIVQMCTMRNPKERPTVSDLLEFPWLHEEMMAYNRRFGLPGRLSMAAVRDSHGSSAKSTGKIPMKATKVRLSPSSLRHGALDTRALLRVPIVWHP
jgi:serine/threonine protein kinase